jgi:hypothetical protein
METAMLIGIGVVLTMPRRRVTLVMSAGMPLPSWLS